MFAICSLILVHNPWPFCFDCMDLVVLLRFNAINIVSRIHYDKLGAIASGFITLEMLKNISTDINLLLKSSNCSI